VRFVEHGAAKEFFTQTTMHNIQNSTAGREEARTTKKKNARLHKRDKK